MINVYALRSPVSFLLKKVSIKFDEIRKVGEGVIDKMRVEQVETDKHTTSVMFRKIHPTRSRRVDPPLPGRTR